MGIQQPATDQNRYTINRPFDTYEGAKYFIQFVKNTTYGSGIKEPVVRFNNADFQIIEGTDGKFYVTYELVKFHHV